MPCDVNRKHRIYRVYICGSNWCQLAAVCLYWVVQSYHKGCGFVHLALWQLCSSFGSVLKHSFTGRIFVQQIFSSLHTRALINFICVLLCWIKLLWDRSCQAKMTVVWRACSVKTQKARNSAMALQAIYLCPFIITAFWVKPSLWAITLSILRMFFWYTQS